jgi:hypothetical protein
MDKQDAKILKRKPGRPRKKPLKEPPSRKGILDTPSCADNLVEVMYDKPVSFKKLSSFWKSLNAEKIAFIFAPTKLIMYTKNYKESNWVRACMDGAKVVSYYCPHDVGMIVLFANLELIWRKLDKAYETVSFIITKKNNGKVLNIILQNEFNIPEYFEIDVIMDHAYGKLFDGVFDEGIHYPLEFKLSGKYFKKAISDTKDFDDQWTIEKYGETGSLMFAYRSINGQVRARNVPKNPKDVITKCDIKQGDIFTVSVFVNNIKPTSANQLADVICFKAAKDKRLLIWADIDEGSIIVDILVDIVDYKKMDK